MDVAYVFNLSCNTTTFQTITRDDLHPLKQQQIRNSLGLKTKTRENVNVCLSYPFTFLDFSDKINDYYVSLLYEYTDKRKNRNI